MCVEQRYNVCFEIRRVSLLLKTTTNTKKVTIVQDFLKIPTRYGVSELALWPFIMCNHSGVASADIVAFYRPLQHFSFHVRTLQTHNQINDRACMAMYKYHDARFNISRISCDACSTCGLCCSKLNCNCNPSLLCFVVILDTYALRLAACKWAHRWDGKRCEKYWVSS